MSRIGRKPINIPAGVDAKFENGVMTVKGPKGTLTQKVHKNMIIKIENGVITVERPNDDKENRSLHGLTRSLIANMIEGVTNGFKICTKSRRTKSDCFCRRTKRTTFAYIVFQLFL